MLGDIGVTCLEFAVIGSTVNAASRLEALTRTLDCALVASDDLVKRAKAELAGAEAVFRPLMAQTPQTIRGLPGWPDDRAPLAFEPTQQRVRQSADQDVVAGGAVFTLKELCEIHRFAGVLHRPFEIGEVLNLTIQLPDSRQVVARGRVVRVSRGATAEQPPGMGIEFVDLSPVDRAAVEAALA